MSTEFSKSLKSEALWLGAIVLAAWVVEYAIILLLELDPVLSVKIQGFIGLLVIGYLIRMSARLFPRNGEKAGNGESLE